MHIPSARAAWGLAAALLLWAPSWAFAQLDLNSLQIDRTGGGPPMADVVKVEARLSNAEGGKAELTVTADVAQGWHIYSITQPPGGPIATKIKLEESDQYRLAGEFAPNPPPDTYPEAAFDNLLVESHEGKVTWTAPVEFAAGVDPAKVEVKGTISFQACDASSCMPPNREKFVARLDKKDATAAPKSPAPQPAAAAGAAGRYRADGAHATIEAYVEPQAVAPGGTATLVVTISPDPEWHVYALADKDPEEVAKPTLIVLSDTAGFTAGRPRADARPIEKASDVFEGAVDRHYEKPVTWKIELRAPADAQSGAHELAGLIGYQTCRDTGCDLPRAVKFSVDVSVDPTAKPGRTAVQFTGAASYRTAAKAAAGDVEELDTDAAGAQAFDPSQIVADDASSAAGGSLPLILAGAFVGGIILNFMPCVLPVIGLKILGFVEQSGDSRARILSLNLWFSGGLISVFLVLATLAAFLGFSWGEQFTSTAFNIVMAAVVFAMALSFLGVWEIPIPGFVGTGRANDLAAKEGAAGAFSKGVLTTVLATPCSGPFLGPVFGFTLRQPPATIYAIFGCIALGMASPYLAIGAFPKMIRFLPRPGAWMDTFKQVMGFVLLGTVVFLMSFISADYFVPTFALLVGVWAACWWIGRTPLTAELNSKLTAWVGGLIVAAGVGLFSFTWLVPGESDIPWQPFSREALVKLTGEGKTVMVDFTADWCLTCKTNEKLALNTDDVSELVQKNGVVPLIADWTDGSPEIKEMLAALGSNSIPVLAFFPADRPNHPIILRDLVSEQEVVEALEKAGPSRTTVARMSAAAPK